MLDELRPLIETYGYLAVGVGCFFEGETAVILGAFAAVRDYLTMPGIVAAAFVGTVIGDNIWFWLGRRLGRPFLMRRRHWRRKSRRVELMARRHSTVTILSVRFLYGLRSVTPFVLGASRVHPLKFLLLESLSAAVWALLMGWLAWLVALAARSAATAENLEWYLVAAVLAVAAAIWIGYFLIGWLRTRNAQRSIE
ncbi:hypothetical protein PC39_15329 [Salinisphaera sp. PC39]|uniref:DedA family protein n=1 Tax=Salinisphaera sp. PC39 TaxID=1304156 RepID=UPI003341F84F